MATQVTFFDPTLAVLANGAISSAAGISHTGKDVAGAADHSAGNWPKLNLATRVRVDSAGNVFIVTQVNHDCHKLDPTMTTQLAVYSTGVQNLSSPRGLLLDEAAGEVFVSNVGGDTVVVLSMADLTYLRHWDTPELAPGGPDDIAFLPNGNILVSGNYNNVNRGTYEYTRTGTLIAKRETPVLNTSTGFRIATHPSNGQLIVIRRASQAGVDRRRGTGLYDYNTGIGNRNAAYGADASTVALYHFATGAALVDSSGNGYTATEVGTTEVAADWGEGRLFDAATDIVVIDAISAGFNGASGSVEVTASAATSGFWTNDAAHYLCYLRANSTNIVEIVKRGASAGNQIRFRYYAGGTFHDISVTMPYPDALEHDFAITFEDTTGVAEFKAYIDGIQVGSTVVVTSAWSGSAVLSSIGNVFSADFGWLGTIDEVRISSAVRTQEYDWVKDLSWGSYRTTVANSEWPLPRQNDAIGNPVTSHGWDFGWGDAFWDVVNGEWLIWIKNYGVEGIYRMTTDGVFFDVFLSYDAGVRVETISAPPQNSVGGIHATTDNIYVATGYSHQVERYDRRTGEGVHATTPPAGATLNQIIATGYEVNKHRVSYRLGGAGGWTVIDPLDLTALAVATSGQLLEVKGEQNVLFGATGIAPLNAQPVPLKLGFVYDDGITLPGISAQVNLTLQSDDGSLLLDTDDAVLLEE